MSTETMTRTSKPEKTKRTREEKLAAKKRKDIEKEQATTPKTHQQETLPKRPRTTSPSPSTSPFVNQTTSFYLPLSPIYHAFPIDGLCAEHISPLLLTYHPPLKAVILSYSNPRLSTNPHNTPSTRNSPDAPKTVLAKSIDEYAVSFVWLTLDFVLLRPFAGAVIEGHVTLQNESYLGLVCWNFFNAGVHRTRIPAEWKWVPEDNADDAVAALGQKTSSSNSDWMKGLRGKSRESSGYYVDGQGNKVQGLVKFTVKDFESAPSTDRERGFLSIEGTLLTPEQDKKCDEELKAAKKVPKRKRVAALVME
jgi:DNA-directed RNA polymerase I subunit RPA43